MAKFETPDIVRLTLQAEFGQDTTSENTITRMYQNFCETGTVEDCQRRERPSTITEKKVDEACDVCESKPNSSTRTVVTACSIPQTTAHRIMTESLSLKPYKAQFVQKIYAEDMQDRTEMCGALIPILQDINIQDNMFFQMEQYFT